MGGGTYSAATYRATTGAKISSGTTFGYDTSSKLAGRYEAHETLDPKAKNSDGVNIRESRDSDDHPNALPIIVAFDSTGSMGSVPRTVQTKLATLFGLLIDKGYAKDPQVSIATYGDVTCDRVPFQISQFESDNRIDDNLDNLFLEGGGGGNGGETSNLLLYYVATHTATDSWEKRGHKGHLFLIADEVQVPITAKHISDTIGDGQPLLEDISFEGIAQAVTEKWNVHVLLIDNYAAQLQGSKAFYENLFGPKSLLIIEDPNTIAETIAAVIGYEEGLVSDDQIDKDITEAAGREVALRVGKTLDSRHSSSSVVRGLR
jgi:hypothetical protein